VREAVRYALATFISTLLHSLALTHALTHTCTAMPTVSPSFHPHDFPPSRVTGCETPCVMSWPMVVFISTHYAHSLTQTLTPPTAHCRLSSTFHPHGSLPQSDSVRDAVREVLASDRVDLRRLGLLCEVYGCPPTDCVAVWTLLVSESRFGNACVSERASGCAGC
jgi:hypothetical protein